MAINKTKQVSLIIMIGLVFLLQISAGQELTDFQMIRSDAGLSLHKDMFMLPVTYSNEYNKKQTEAVFQISAKHEIFGTGLYFAYTQISFWQAYDKDNSAPFRETNYNPELFYRFKPLSYSSGHVGADLGFEFTDELQVGAEQDRFLDGSGQPQAMACLLLRRLPAR